MANRKITDVGGTEGESMQNQTWQPTAESASKAKTNRIISIVLWVLAFAVQIGVIFKLRENPVDMVWVIGLIVVQLILVVIGNVLWKKANRLDPASEKDKFKFFVQNQLGAILSVLAFLPLVVLILTNKNLSGKQKGILGSVAGAALVIAGLTGTEFNPASIEQYTEQTERVKELNNGVNHVFWTKSGSSYHLYEDCGYIKKRDIWQGTVAKARELKNITDLCDRCARQAEKERSILEPATMQ